ncbi:IS66-like element accessory protein TnpA [Roseomonas sp. HF4]|uniref:IS66-like element accessory protein TnpA n=1 Tax=Roseomonas sp. HF4 TaxID=2562313 RepID=UPI0010BFCB9E|nr:transposase [Roseomonas sp. HF4]
MEIEVETASAHTRSRRSVRSEVVEVITRGERRRAWSADQKRLIVSEAMQPGAMPAEVARRWGIGTGLLYTWRRQLLAGEFGEPPVPAFAQVTLAPAAEPEAAPPDPMTRSSNTVPALPGRMEITLPGGAVVCVGADVDGAALRRVLAALAPS